MDRYEVFYTPKYHPHTSQLIKQALNSTISLLVLTLLTVGVVLGFRGQ